MQARLLPLTQINAVALSWPFTHNGDAQDQVLGKDKSAATQGKGCLPHQMARKARPLISSSACEA
jgi:hypothetical protein